MECTIRGAYLNAYLPLACHTEIAIGTEVTFPVWKQVDGVGSHIHHIVRACNESAMKSIMNGKCLHIRPHFCSRKMFHAVL